MTSVTVVKHLNIVHDTVVCRVAPGRGLALPMPKLS